MTRIYEIQAKAAVEIAEATYSVPAKQNTCRTAMILSSILTLVVLAAVLKLEGGILNLFLAAVIAIGGAWGVTAIIKAAKNKE